MKKLLIFMVLGLTGYINSQEIMVLIPKYHPDHANNAFPPASFLPRVNLKEIALAKSYVQSEMQWAQDFYKAHMLNPEVVKTEAEAAAHKRQAIKALLDHISAQIKAHEQGSVPLAIGSCGDCNEEYRDNVLVKNDRESVGCKVVASIFGLGGMFVIAPMIYLMCRFPFKIYVENPPQLQCQNMLKYSFLNQFVSNCTRSSTFYNEPINETELVQQYGADLAWRHLNSMCTDMAQNQCASWAIEYNKHEYPKQLLKAVLPAAIIVPLATVAFIGSQIMACKYRRWQRAADDLYVSTKRIKANIGQDLQNLSHDDSNAVDV